MDLLDRVLGPGRDLLSRVDATLAASGAPPEHPVWSLLRRVGALPGDVLEYVAALDPEPLADVAVELRARSDGYAGHRAGLDATVATSRWDGTAGTAFNTRWGALGGHLGDAEGPDEPSMAGRLVALRGYLDDVGHWMTATRDRLAATLADALASAEAVQLRAAGSGYAGVFGGTGASGAGGAAAAVGARILEAVDAALTEGYQLHGRWLPRLGELPFEAPEVEYSVGGETRVEF